MPAALAKSASTSSSAFLSDAAANTVSVSCATAGGANTPRNTVATRNIDANMTDLRAQRQRRTTRAHRDEATAPGPSFRASAERARRPADRNTRTLASRRGRGKALAVVTPTPALHTPHAREPHDRAGPQRRRVRLHRGGRG